MIFVRSVQRIKKLAYDSTYYLISTLLYIISK